MPGCSSDALPALRLSCLASAFLVMALAPAGVRSCFDTCDCISSQLRCRETRLPSIPTTSVHYTTVEFKNNPFASHALSRSNLTGLTAVVKLSIVACGIETIDALTFSDLRSMTWLDLSDNNIGQIQPFTFASINLVHLFLNRNSRMQLVHRSFEGLNTSGLYLSQCGLASGVNAEVMQPLQRWLRTLWIDGNGISTLDSSFAELFPSLETLRMGDNPLNCDCRLLWLRQNAKFSSLTGSADASQPRCATPQWLSGQLLASVSAPDMRCLPGSLDLSFAMATDGSKVAVCSMAVPAASFYSLAISRRSDDGSEASQVGSMDSSGLGRAVASIAVSQRPCIYKCTAIGRDGNVSVSINVTWPQQQQQGDVVSIAIPNEQSTTKSALPTSPCIGLTSQRPASSEPLSHGSVTAGMSSTPAAITAADAFTTKYFSLVDLLGTAFGTFAATLVICTLVLHFCVYKIRHASPRYEQSSAQSSDYGTGSVKSYMPPPPPCRTLPTPSSTVPSLGISSERRLLSVPRYKHQNPVFDENHYMTTNLDEVEFLNQCHGQPCVACQQSMIHSSVGS